MPRHSTLCGPQFGLCPGEDVGGDRVLREAGGVSDGSHPSLQDMQRAITELDGHA